MSKTIELEKTYLAKYVPGGAWECESKEIIDVYFPKIVEHPILRLRKRGEKYEMTKKQPVDGNDSSRQHEHTIELSEEEFAALAKADGKRVAKRRYYFPHDGRTLEIDVFFENLSGLVVVDAEFETVEEMASFIMPDFCLVDVTQDALVAGGMLAGKSYAQIEDGLKRYGYGKINDVKG